MELGFRVRGLELGFGLGFGVRARVWVFVWGSGWLHQEQRRPDDARGGGAQLGSTALGAQAILVRVVAQVRRHERANLV